MADFLGQMLKGKLATDFTRHRRINVRLSNRVKSVWNRRVKDLQSLVKTGESSGVYHCFGEYGIFEQGVDGLIVLSKYGFGLTRLTTWVGQNQVSRMLKGYNGLDAYEKIQTWLDDAYVNKWLKDKLIDYDYDEPDSWVMLDSGMFIRHTEHVFQMESMPLVCPPYVVFMQSHTLGVRDAKAHCPVCLDLITGVVGRMGRYITTVHDIGVIVPYISDFPIRGRFKMEGAFAGTVWIMDNYSSHGNECNFETTFADYIQSNGVEFIYCYHTTQAYGHYHIHKYSKVRNYLVSGKQANPFEITVLASFLNVVYALNKSNGVWFHKSIFCDFPVPLRLSYDNMAEHWRPYLIAFLAVICYGTYPEVNLGSKKRAWEDLTVAVNLFRDSETYIFLSAAVFHDFIPISFESYEKIVDTANQECVMSHSNMTRLMHPDGDEVFDPPIKEILRLMMNQS